MAGEEKLHFVPLTGRAMSPSGKNQVHLNDKSSSGQSLLIATPASLGHPDDGRYDRSAAAAKLFGRWISVRTNGAPANETADA
jgi:hypothetical protein